MVAVEDQVHRVSILCDVSVFEITEARFAFEARPPVTVKGKSELIPVYRPLRKRGEGEVRSANLATSNGQKTLQIDRLPPAEQTVLKVASVIGLTFTVETLTAIYPEARERGNLSRHLAALGKHGFIVQNLAQSSSFTFKDAAIHESAYSPMLFAQRRQLHRAAAELLEQADEDGPPYAEIAHHWQASDDIPKAVISLEKAGEQAHLQGRFDEATRHFKASLALNT